MNDFFLKYKYQFNKLLGPNKNKQNNSLNVRVLYPRVVFLTAMVTEIDPQTNEKTRILVDLVKDLKQDNYYVRSTSCFKCNGFLRNQKGETIKDQQGKNLRCNMVISKASIDRHFTYDSETESFIKHGTQKCIGNNCQREIDKSYGEVDGAPRTIWLNAKGLGDQDTKEQFTKALVEEVKKYSWDLSKNDVHGTRNSEDRSFDGKISDENKEKIIQDFQALLDGKRDIYGNDPYIIDEIENSLNNDSEV